MSVALPSGVRTGLALAIVLGICVGLARSTTAQEPGAARAASVAPGGDPSEPASGALATELAPSRESPVPAAASSPIDPATLIDRALELYAKAQETPPSPARVATFGESERLLSAVAESRDASAALWVAAGNAALQAERLGAAVVAYRRALARDPDMPTARRNLVYARELLPAWVPRPDDQLASGSFASWLLRRAPAERRAGAAIAFLAASALFAAGYGLRLGWLRNLAWVPGVAWGTIVAVSVLAVGDGGTAQGVITVDDAQARAADSSLAPPLFPSPLPAGTEVSVRETRTPWAKIRLANGREAWVSESAFTRID